MDRALQMREILSTRGLTLYNVSRRSAEIFGRSSQFYVPHNLYYEVVRTLSIPTIFQILALSHITDYRLSDWLAVFGFHLDAISRLQLLIPRQQTTILDSTVYDINAWIPWFAERPEAGAASTIAPLGHLLTWAAPERAKDLLVLNKRKSLYAMVGERDWYAVPYFVPGSIVRVDARRSEALSIGNNPNGEVPFFLLEHNFGWTCSRLSRLGKDRVLLHCPQRPCMERELHIGREAKILGMVDAEIRPVGPEYHAGRVKAKSAASPKARPERPPGEPASLKHLLRHSRIRVELSFRDASSISRWIADTLADDLYFAAPSTLSDYETLAAPPRHIQKIITLCVLYRIGFWELLRTSGLPLELEGHDAIPDELARRHVPSGRHRVSVPSEEAYSRDQAGFLGFLLKQWEEIPLFLKPSLVELTGLKNFALSDVFWVGGDKVPCHPLLRDAYLVAVNRRVKKPLAAAGKAVCQQPLYLILKRDGGYLCGHCILEQGHLVLSAYPGGSFRTQRFRNGRDAEVIGQVTTILRRLLP